MYLPPLQPINNTEIRICGDVDIHPSASIAPGAILQASADSRIVIGADACIGMGTIISAYNGEIEIASGVTLGSGVLIVGSGKVGSNACIGTATTIFNCSVKAMEVVEPGSILGDRSRFSEKEALSHQSTDQPKESTLNLDEDSQIQSTTNGSVNKDNLKTEIIKEVVVQEVELELEEVKESVEAEDPWKEQAPKTEENATKKDIVDLAVKEVKSNLKLDDDTTIGKVYIDQLSVTLFPHKKQFNKRLSSPENQDNI